MSILLRDEELEEAVLGSLLMDFETVPVCMPKLDEDCFYSKNKEVFQAIKQDYETNGDVDMMRVEHTLKSDGNEDIVSARLAGMVKGRAMVHRAEEYCDMLRDLADRRDGAKGMSEIMGDLQSISAREMVTRLEDLIQKNLSGNGVPGLTYSQIKERDANRPTAEQLYTGDKFLDATFFRDSGSRRGTMMTLFGDTGSGKTSLAGWFASRYLEQGYRGAMCIRESKDSKVADRIYRNMTNKGNIDNLIIADTQQGIGHLEDIVSTVKYHNAVKPIDFFIVDHLRIIPVKGLNYWDENAKITACANRMMYLAQEVDALCIALSQVNRATLQNASGWKKDPDLNNLYGSSAIEQASEMAISIFRPKEHKELLVHYPSGDLRAVKGANYNDDQADTYDPNSVFIQQKKTREGERYPAYVRFIHKENGLERVPATKPF